MVGEEEEEKRRWWWFESHHKTTTTSSKQSQWLHSTLAELDSKTNAMLSLIEEGNSDSFAQRAETYYKKRPELISFVHDCYRAHRSLAHRFHHLKSSSSSFSIDHSLSDDPHSEIDDPDDEEDDHHQGNASDHERLKKLIQEIDALKRQLLDKDEEKREVIRQLSLTLDSRDPQGRELESQETSCVSQETQSFPSRLQVPREAVPHLKMRHHHGNKLGNYFYAHTPHEQLGNNTFFMV